MAAPRSKFARRRLSFTGLFGLFGLLLFSCLTPARADLLDIIWIGPSGTGGAGNWNVAAHWDLGVIPNNGVDTYRVFIDGGKVAVSPVTLMP